MKNLPAVVRILRAEDCLAGRGEMGALVRAFGWPRTPLGPIESWPHSLQLVVSLCLNSLHPALIWWGPELIMLYNDACRSLLGKTRYTQALGQPGPEGWPENWPVLGPKLKEVLVKGEAICSEKQPLFLECEGYFEEGSFTLLHTPIRDETGQVRGIFTTALETTAPQEKRTGARVEASLPESEKRYHALVEAMPAFIWQADTRGNLIYNSENFYHYTGLNPNDLNGWSWQTQEVVHPDDLPEMVERWRRSLATGNNFETELRLRGVDGFYRWHLNRGLPVRNGDGQVTGWVGTSTNIDERKQAEEALREQATMLNLAQVMICDLENRITFWNQGAEKLYGWTQVEALGQVAHELLQAGFPQPLAKIKAKLLQTGSWQGELIHTRRDGSQIVVASHWVLHKDRQGQPLSIFKINSDITQLKRTEAALRTAHQRNTYILNNMKDAFLIFDQAWRYLYINEAGLTQARKSREALLGQKVWEVFPDLVGSEVQRQWERVMAERVPASFEFYYAPYDTWFDYGVYPALEGIAVFVSDITARKQAEIARRESEGRFRAFMDNTPSQTFIKDVEGRYLFVNRKVEKVFNRPLEEWVGQTDVELFPEEPAAALWRENDQTVLATGQTMQFTELLPQSDGERYMLSVKFRMQASQGQTYLGGVAIDITEQKRVEQTLRESEGRFRVLADNAPVLIWVNGLEGAQFVNRAYLEFLGVGEVEVQRYDWTQFVHPEDREAYVNAYLEAFNRRSLFEAQFRFRRADGEYRWMKSKGVPRLTPTGEFLGYVGSTFDIADIIQAEEALRESESQLHLLTQSLERQVDERTAELARSVEELNQFAYTVSHDLKAPLRAVKQLAGWIVEDSNATLPEISKTHLSKLQGRIGRMEKFLDDLLIYSRAGRAYYQSLERIDTGALVKEMIEILAPPPGFTFTLQENMPLLRSYRTPLELVFKSLIDNAIKHHHQPEGHVQVSAREKGEFIEFTVTDDGPGLDPAFHERIFQIFQTLKPRDEVEGSGVGLAIAKRAVESQGGTIEVISREGQGATFRFTWPLSSES